MMFLFMYHVSEGKIIAKGIECLFMNFIIPLYVSHTPSSLNAASERRRGFQTASENLIAIQLSGMVNRWCHLYSFSFFFG
jgi:hypothetical protein